MANYVQAADFAGLLACLFASWLVGRSFFCERVCFVVPVCVRCACVFACVCVLRVCFVCACVFFLCVACACGLCRVSVCLRMWLAWWVDRFFVASALRVPPAETRLTVYRRLEYGIGIGRAGTCQTNGHLW